MGPIGHSNGKLPDSSKNEDFIPAAPQAHPTLRRDRGSPDSLHEASLTLAWGVTSRSQSVSPIGFSIASLLFARNPRPQSTSAIHVGNPRPTGTKKCPVFSFEKTGLIPGDDLLSQDLSSHYHRRCGVSLPGSGWDRVVPPRSGHQRATLFFQGLGLWGSELCLSAVCQPGPSLPG